MSDAKPTTLHDRILTEVRGNILSGTWPLGYRIPFETDMASTYGVSRMTVNKVLTQLTREGYLERRRKSGTRVTKPRGQSAVMAITNSGDEVRQRGEAYSFTTLKRKMRRAEVQDMVLLRSADPAITILELEYVHRADGEPFCHEARIINLAAVPEAEHADFSAEQAGTWLLRQVPWSSAEHLIRAVNPAAHVARLLGVSVATACLEIERRTEYEGRPITHTRLTYPGDKHQLVARFSPQMSAQTSAQTSAQVSAQVSAQPGSAP